MILNRSRLFVMGMFSAALMLTSCDEEPAPFVVPDTYDGNSFEVNAASELELIDDVNALASLMKTGRSGATVAAADVEALYTPNLQAVTTTYYQDKIMGTEGWIANLAASSGNTFDPLNATQGDGGVFGGYLFDENGLELQQVFEKGLYMAALYNQAAVVASEPNATTADKLVALFGANPDFNNSDNGDLHDNPDVLMAKYVARRDQNDGNGFYTNMGEGFRALQAAYADEETVYETEASAALETIFTNWEAGNAATVINYLYSAIGKFSATTPTDEDLGSALHSYSESVGFLHGLRTVSSPYRIISDAQIDAVLALMNAPYDGTPTSYLLITDAFNQVSKLETAVQSLAAVYGFSETELESFKSNWISVQGR
ncbi:hypothetical protein [Pontibacter sp. G13]|uniref:hypothetical protein n=1 Tax=Pontibacter sp. G13 TaxID=3074898 RepID=UPI0028892DC8|nr:hypothetical protein [Pontibacter sp. G13]WNJ20698.1 hypothetical protein RJD25_09470 [Pontibacter sp. G13]